VSLEADEEKSVKKGKEPSDLMESLRRSLKVIEGGKSSKKKLPNGHSKNSSERRTDRTNKSSVKIVKASAVKSKLLSRTRTKPVRRSVNGSAEYFTWLLTDGFHSACFYYLLQTIYWFYRSPFGGVFE